MPARHSQQPILRTAVFALALGAAACDGADSPVAPGGAESVVPESAAPAPDFLTAGTGPRILFSSARTGGTDIYRMDPDGNNVVRVTSFTGAEQTPAWSWDNKRIAMVRTRIDASTGWYSDIFLTNADGTGKRWARPAASAFEITDPAWSPDGTRLVVVAWIMGAGRLALINVATGDITFISVVLGGPVGYFPAFDPTGTTIVYVGANSELETIHPDGTGHQVIAAGPAGSTVSPAFSPDGKRIAFGRNVAGNFDIYVKNLVTGTVKRLTTNVAGDFDPTWSADGSRIAFVSLRSGKSQIWTVSSAGGTQVRITHTGVAEGSPAWSH
jgi:Tol biopolymer transport system component